MQGRAYVFAILGILALALATRVYDLGNEHPWIDEVQSIETSASEPGVLLARTAFADVHPPLYYFMLKGFGSIVGPDATMLRWLSILASVIGLVLLAWPRTKEPLERNLRVMCATIFGLHAGHIHFSQELRSYAWFSLSVFIALILLRRLLRKPSMKRIFWASLALASTLWLHHFGWIYSAGLVLGLHLFAPLNKNQVKVLAFTSALAFVWAAAWVPLMVHQLTGLPIGFRAHVAGFPSIEEIARLIGPWGGLAQSVTALTGFILFIAVSSLTMLRQRRDAEVRETVDVPLPWHTPIWLSLAGLTLSLSLFPLIPMPDEVHSVFTQSQWFSVGVCLVGPPIIFLLSPFLTRIPTYKGFHTTHAMVFGVVIALVVALLVQQLGEARLMLPLVLLLLESNCVDATRATVERVRPVRTLPILFVILLPSLPSSVRSSQYIQPRPDIDAVMTLLREEKRSSLYVHPCYDYPVFSYYQSQKISEDTRAGSLKVHLQNKCFYEEGRLVLSPPDTSPMGPLVAFPRNTCEEALKLLHKDPVLQAAKAHESAVFRRRGACVIALTPNKVSAP